MRTPVIAMLVLAGCAASLPRASSAHKQLHERHASVTYRDLGAIDTAACASASWTTRVRGGCVAIAASRATSSTGLDAMAATDGDPCTTFNSQARASHTLTIELADAANLSAIVLATEQTPDGATAQFIEVSDDGSAWSEVASVGGVTRTQRLYGVAFERRSARFVRLSTLVSPSWVAFREVTLLSCRGPAHLSGTVVPAAPPTSMPGARWARGRGRCDDYADCVQAACCYAPTCIARRTPLDCSDVSCPRTGPMRELHCDCVEGVCGAWIADGEGSAIDL